MRSIRVLLLAFVAVMGFGALAATSASALLFLTVLNLELFLGVIEKLAKLQTLKGSEVDCSVVLVHGYALNKTDRVDLLLFTFHKCESSGLKCTSSGEPEGLIKTLDLHALLVTLLPSQVPAPKNFGIKIEPETTGGPLASFSCAGVQTIVVEGSVVGHFTELESNKALPETNIEFANNGTAGMPAWPTYDTLEGTGSAILTSKLTGLINETVESAEVASGKIHFLHPESDVCGS